MSAIDQTESDTEEPVVLTAVDEGVGIITLNRPGKHNAFNTEQGEAFEAALEWALRADDVTAVLLRGNGKSFSSGRDTSKLTGERGVTRVADVRAVQRLRTLIYEAQRPVVAELKGATLGGAAEIALSADLRIAADPLKFGFPEAEFGIMTDTGGTPLTTILAGPSRAKYLAITGARIDAQQALAWGLVDFVVPAEDLPAEALTLAKRLAAAPPMVATMVKEVVNSYTEDVFRAGLRSELLAQMVLFKSDDAAEVRRARTESRPPKFTNS